MNNLLKVTLLVLGVTLLSCNNEEKAPEQHEHVTTVESYYTCSMHPQIKEDKPGKCPICHMPLTKVEVEKDHAAVPVQKTQLWKCQNFPDITSDKPGECPVDGTAMVQESDFEKASQVVAKVKLRKSQMQHFRPDFFPVSPMKMTKDIRLLGTILQSEEKESRIPARIDGRVETVYVKSTGSYINKGDPVIELYSPKLITAGEEYILARDSYLKNKGKEFKDMLKQSEERLALWGILPSQYEKWYAKKKVPNKITIYSPSTGIVRKRNAVVGKYFKEGQNFFELTDLEDVWVEMDVYEHDASLVKLGQHVSLKFSSLPGETTEGDIDFVDPVIDRNSRTLKVRATIKNLNGKLKPGMVADATLHVKFDGEPLVIPRSSIIDTGKRKVVWVKVTDNQFQAKKIQTGLESEGYVEVKNGLMNGEEVVIEGNFLLDAQAQLFGGYEDMQAQNNGAHEH